MRFRFIEDHRDEFPTRLMCLVLGVSASGSYAWRGRPESQRAAANRQLLVEVRRVHGRLHGRHGSPRVHAALRAEGVAAMAIQRQRPAVGLIQHSDRGSQYASRDYRDLLQAAGMRQSMSRKGCCYDNAPMDSFFHTLKVELVHHTRFETRDQARGEVFAYIETYYNRQRAHSAIGYITPEQAELRSA